MLKFFKLLNNFHTHLLYKNKRFLMEPNIVLTFFGILQKNLGDMSVYRVRVTNSLLSSHLNAKHKTSLYINRERESKFQISAHKVKKTFPLALYWQAWCPAPSHRPLIYVVNSQNSKKAMKYSVMLKRFSFCHSYKVP